MREKFKFFLKIAMLGVLFAFTNVLYAQRNITGLVKDAKDGSPVPGVNVLVKGTTVGAVTDGNGNFQIAVPSGSNTIVVSSVGYKTQEITLTDAQTNYEVLLENDSQELSELVVTALGIERKSKSLTYSTQKVSGNELTRVKDMNMINSLSGKTAGLVINKSSSGLGGSSRVIIRGNKSIGGENQPLYVIDGLPINNSTMGQIGGSQLSGTVDGGDAISNINPEDIESINVLKGASASALYGSLGQNGVILITTKKGAAGKTSVEFSSSTSFEKALLLPELQGSYGLTTAVNLAKLDNDPTTWGAKNNGAISTSDLKDFFKTGVSTINSISITNGNEKNQLYLSYANTYGKGIVEKNTLSKNNIYIKGSSKLYKNLTVEGSANLISQTIKNRPFVGFQSNPAGEAYLFPGSSSDLKNYKTNYQKWDIIREINVQNYPYSDFNSSSYILDNPYWTIHNNPNKLERTRNIYTASVKLDLTNDLNVRMRTNYDRVEDQYEQDVYGTSSSIVFDSKGAYNLQKNITNQIYSDFLVSYSKEIKDLSVNALAGFSNNYSKGYAMSVQTINGNNNFIATNTFSLSNLQGSFTHPESTTETLTQSLFGSVTLGYKKLFFLDLTDREEWASTITNKPFNYPSVGGTFILSELTGTSDLFNFANLRASYSKVGNSLPYGVNNASSRLYWQIINGSPNSPAAGLPIKDGKEILLEPEETKSVELGFNLRLFSNSIDLDFTYYNNNIENQFFTVSAPLGAHVPSYYVNAGKVSNKGVEVSLTYKLAPKNGLSYSTNINFAYNKNEILSVNDELELDTYTITRYANTKIGEIRMVKGGEFGDIYAPTFARDAQGKILLKDNAPVATGNYVKVANPNAPTSLGWTNTFNYKGFTFNMLIDGKIGGDVISFTEAALDANGRSQRSAESRDAGSVVFEGTTVATGNDQIQKWYQGLATIGSNYVYDATNFRIREISIGYDVPVKFTKGVIKNLQFSVNARNLLFLYNKAPFDPEVSAGSSTGLQGLEALSLPSTRTFGFGLKATF